MRYYSRLQLDVLSLVLFCFAGFQKTVCAQAVTHTYHFVNSLKASEPCGPALQFARTTTCNAPAGGGVFLNDQLSRCKSQRTVFANNLNWGLSYPNKNGLITDEYTIHLYIKMNEWGTRQWARIIDFSNGLHDKGIYFKDAAQQKRKCLDFYPNGIIGPCPYFEKNVYCLLSFTRDKESKIIDVYVDGQLFTSFHDESDMYCSAGQPIYIFRDDEAVPCESGQAYFAYLSFSNKFSDKAMVQYAYQSICKLSKPLTLDFSLNAVKANIGENVMANYTGNVSPFDAQYTFHWSWDGGNPLPAANGGSYKVKWQTPGIKKITLVLENTTCKSKKIISKQVLVTSANLISGLVKPSVRYHADSNFVKKPVIVIGNKSIRLIEDESDLIIVPVDSGAITLSFYDNAEIDGDSITVFVNNVPVVFQTRLTATAVDHVVKEGARNKPVLVEIKADNEGSISPNTCLLVIRSNNFSKEIFVSSFISRHKKIRLEYNPASLRNLPQ